MITVLLLYGKSYRTLYQSKNEYVTHGYDPPKKRCPDRAQRVTLSILLTTPFSYVYLLHDMSVRHARPVAPFFIAGENCLCVMTRW